MFHHRLRISPDGIALIKKFQGLSLEKYCDESGLWVIGYGHVITPSDNFSKLITPLHAKYLLYQDLRECEDNLSEIVDFRLTQNQHDALISLLFSSGCSRLVQTGIIREIKRGCYANAMQIWQNETAINGTSVASLTALRQAECALFFTGLAIEA